MHVSWSKSLSLRAVIRQHFLEQPTMRKVAEAAPCSRRLPNGSLLWFRQSRCGFNLDRSRLRVGNALYLDVVSLVVSELVWILDRPDLVVAIGDQCQFGTLLNVVF